MVMLEGVLRAKVVDVASRRVAAAVRRASPYGCGPGLLLHDLPVGNAATVQNLSYVVVCGRLKSKLSILRPYYGRCASAAAAVATAAGVHNIGWSVFVASTLMRPWQAETNPSH